MGRLGLTGFTPLLTGSVNLASLSFDFAVGERKKKITYLMGAVVRAKSK